MSQTPSAYIHGSTPSEQRRLAGMNAYMNPRALAELGLSGGERILEVGCGLGIFARDMARAAGTTVVGIERDAGQRSEGERLAAEAGEAGLIDFRAGDVRDFPLHDDEWGSFDVAHGRFILEHVPNPSAVVEQMVRAVKPGGRIVLADDDHDTLRMWPDCPEYMRVWEAYFETYHAAGNDPLIGRKLPALLHEAGARPTRCNLIYFGACAGMPEFASVLDNFEHGVRGTRDAVLAGGEVSAEAFEAGMAALREWGQHPGAGFWYPYFWAEGVR